MSQPLDLAAVQAHTAGTSLKDAWQARLERWDAHPGLYRWSLSNPLTRWLTRRRTRKLFERGRVDRNTFKVPHERDFTF